MEISESALTAEQQDAQFCRAFEQLSNIIDWQRIDAEFSRRGNAVYLNSLVIMLMLFQRMCPDKSLEATVKRLLEIAPHLLPQDRKRVREKTLSSNPAGYAKARKNCKIEAVKRVSDAVSKTLVERTRPSWQGRRVIFMDGTTATLAPESELRKVFPPARNQFGDSPFPTVLLLMGFELESGAALVPVTGAMFGEQAVSETALVEELIQQLPEQCVLMADANFGIFAVAWEAHQQQHDFLFRLTAARFKALQKKAVQVRQRGCATSYTLRWRPSAKDRATHPDLPADAELKVELHEVRLSETLTLYLVTTLTGEGEALADLYHHRYDAEIDIRNFKVTLGAELSRVQSKEMFEKELWMSVVSYNLVCQFRREAAQRANLKPRELSFKRVLTTFEIFLLSRLFKSPQEAKAAFERAIKIAMKDKLPNRPDRHFEREAYQRRHKSAQFKKRTAKE